MAGAWGTAGSGFRVRHGSAWLALALIGSIAVALDPDVARVLTLPLVIQAHLYFALAAFGLGLIVLARRKGDLAHRIMGWTWVTMIAAAIVSSFFIMEQDPGRFSWIHITSVVHGATLALGVLFAKLRIIRWHARLMAFTYVSGLVGAALLAFIPGRVMWEIFFGG